MEPYSAANGALKLILTDLNLFQVMIKTYCQLVFVSLSQFQRMYVACESPTSYHKGWWQGIAFLLYTSFFVQSLCHSDLRLPQLNHSLISSA